MEVNLCRDSGGEYSTLGHAGESVAVGKCKPKYRRCVCIGEDSFYLVMVEVVYYSQCTATPRAGAPWGLLAGRALTGSTSQAILSRGRPCWWAQS